MARIDSRITDALNQDVLECLQGSHFNTKSALMRYLLTEWVKQRKIQKALKPISAVIP